MALEDGDQRLEGVSAAPLPVALENAGRIVRVGAHRREQDDQGCAGGEKGAKEQGKMRLEGKDYLMQDGDVVHFRFNV